MDTPPDYASCSLAVLVVLRGRINRRKFPERHQEVVSLIQQRQPDLTHDEKEAFEERMKHNRNARLISLLFFCGGMLAFIVGFLLPLVSDLQARSWIPTACIIHHVPWSRLRSEHIEYNYTFNGRQYKSGRLNIEDSTSTMQPWFNKYPDGSQARCFVNPSRPQEAALTRGLSGSLPVGLFAGLGMLGAGAYGFFRPEGMSLNRKNPWTSKELRRISYENIRNRDSK